MLTGVSDRQYKGQRSFYSSVPSGRFDSIGGLRMTIYYYQTALSSSTDNFNQRPKSRKASPRAALTPDEQEQLVWERRRRAWEKRQQGANRHHPARDREALRRLRSAAVSS